MFNSLRLSIFTPLCLFSLLFLTLFPLTAAVSMICYSPESLLPLYTDCEDLVTAIDYLAGLPDQTQPKTWGRRLPDSAETQSLPKVYYYNGPGPGFSTCAVEVDTDPQDAWALETFTLKRVEIAAENIVEKCLEDNRLVGLATLGEGGKVRARVFRTDRPRLLGAGTPLGVGAGGKLWVLEGGAATRVVWGEGSRQSQ